MTADEFVFQYLQVIATQRWESVEPLIHDDACVTFSTGTVHKGKPAVRAAFEENFSAIADERYRISNPHWVLRTADVAVYIFDFHWTGRIDGREVSGGGRGTSVLLRSADRWQLIAEHLGPMPG